MCFHTVLSILSQVVLDLVEQASEALIARLLSLLLLLGLSSSGFSNRFGGSGDSSSGVRIGVGDAVLELFYLRPAVLGLHSDGQNLLVGVDDGVHDGGERGEVGSQGDGGDGSNGAGEGLEKLRLLNIQDAGGEGVAIIIDLADGHSVGEGGDVQHVQEGSLGGSDLVTSLNELQVCRDFNSTTGNLGGDTESLEERCLSGFHASVTSRDVDIGRCNGTSTSGRSDLVGKNLLTDLLQVAVGEDESDVALDEGEQTLVLWVIGNEALDGAANLFESS